MCYFIFGAPDPLCEEHGSHVIVRISYVCNCLQNISFQTTSLVKTFCAMDINLKVCGTSLELVLEARQEYALVAQQQVSSLTLHMAANAVGIS